MDFEDFNESWARWWFRTMGVNDRRRLWTKLEKLLSNNVQLLAAVDSINKRTPSKTPTAFALESWKTQLENGARLYEAVDGWVSEEEVMLLQAGEQSGSITETLGLITNILQAKKQIKSAIIGGVAYPLLLMALACAILYVFGFKLVPIFQEVAPGDKWTGMARNMINMSEFVQNWMIYIAGAMVTIVILFFISLPRWDGTVRIFLDKYIPYSIYKVIVGSSWLIAVAALIRAGMRNDTALQQLSEKANPWLKTRIRSCLIHMRGGINMGDALAASGYEFPDAEIIADLGILANYSGFTEALFTIGTEWITESVNQIELRMKMLRTAGIMAIAGLLCFMVSGLIAMQMQMSEIIQQGMM